jgi:hypothetical protein
MDLFRNVEMLLMLAFGVLCAGACLLEPTARSAPANDLPAYVAQFAPSAQRMQVVVISARRMTPAEKRADGAGA